MPVGNRHVPSVGGCFGANATRLIYCVLFTVALTGCVAAPGMKMSRPPSVAIAPDASGTVETQSPVPMVNIDLTLIRKLRQTDTGNDVGRESLIGAPGPYKIGVGDVLQITVWDHPELAAALGAPAQSSVRPADAPAGFIVDEGGNLVFPYAGRIHVAGLRPDQVQSMLAGAFGKSFRDPQVTVRIASFRSQRIDVEGEVHTPGTQPINDIPMTLSDAISRAGGFSATADQSHVVLQRKSVRTVIDMSGARGEKIDLSQIVLKDGDVLRIPSRDEFGVFVMGEVNRPVTAIPRNTGTLSLSEALAQAGSLNTNSADAGQLYVIRGSLDGMPQVFRLDASSPVAMVLANEFPLEPKDIVYVDGNGLVRLSRVLSLLLPAINAGLTAAIVTK
ncbi:polysaccharide biosynthesis/export family protein [Paraburkholderia sediminicola]|uniref:polysaccharide biosynthesis/export family protein n=1 Tax=Paraburkholderia sediminicola TaxID=458836 RepID=UPI0038BB3BA7